MGLNFAEKDYANFLLGGIYFQNILLKNIYFKYGLNLLLPYDFVPITDLGSFDFNKMIEDNSMIGYGIKLTYKSILGPISGGVSMNSRDAYLRYYLSIGLSFNYSD
jgi:NTE family protein